jgi:serine/threonine-protein kinase
MPGTFEGNQLEAQIREALVRKAVRRFRVLEARHLSILPDMRWLVSNDGTKAVHVLPQAGDGRQQESLRELGTYVQRITMNHPGLAPILDTGYYWDYPYMVARLIAGAQTLAKRLNVSMDAERVLRLAGHLAEALEYAHYRDLYHGALSIEDIYVNDRDVPTILGVGLNQLQLALGVAEQSEQTALTPPEVLAGNKPDKRSDVYALAALVYLLIAGKPARPGRAVNLSLENPDVPPAVDLVLTKALAANPDHRYQDLVEMGLELRLATHSPKAESPSPQPRPRTSTAVEPSLPGGPEQPEPLKDPDRAAAGATGTMSGFPEPLPMPEIDVSTLNQALLMPEIAPIELIEIPPAPEVPEIDWDSLLQPVDVSHLSNVRITTSRLDEIMEEIPDPLLAAARAAREKADQLEATANHQSHTHPQSDQQKGTEPTRVRPTRRKRQQ